MVWWIPIFLFVESDKYLHPFFTRLNRCPLRRDWIVGWVLVFDSRSFLFHPLTHHCKCSCLAWLLNVWIQDRFMSSVWNFWPQIADVSLRFSHIVAEANERRLYSQASLTRNSRKLKSSFYDYTSKQSWVIIRGQSWTGSKHSCVIDQWISTSWTVSSCFKALQKDLYTIYLIYSSQSFNVIEKTPTTCKWLCWWPSPSFKLKARWPSQSRFWSECSRKVYCRYSKLDD